MSQSRTRRRWIALFLWMSFSLLDPAAARADEPKNPDTLRLIAYNVYDGTGWPKDRPRGHAAVALGQMPQRFAMELALHAPDIITLSEAPKEPVVAEIARLMKMNYVFLPSGGKWPGAILTRFDIVDSGNAPNLVPQADKTLFTRHWGMARLKLPDGQELVVHSAHLHPSDSSIRQREIATMLETMHPDLAAGRPLILMGDMNHEPLPPEYDLWTQAGWTDSFTAGQGKDGCTFQADGLNRRIDYVFTAGPLAKTILESRPLFEGAFRFHQDDPHAFCLSDHLPQLCVVNMKP